MNEKMMPRTLITRVFEILHQRQLDYCIQNKYEQMPDEMPSDIDMFYRNATEEDLDSIVAEICEKTGTIVTQKIATGFYQFTYNLSFAEISNRFQFQLDFYSELSSPSFPHVYLPSDMLDTKRYYKCFYVPKQSHEVCYQVIRRAMKKDMDSEHMNTIFQCYQCLPEESNDVLKKYWGEDLGKQIISAIVNKDVLWFEDFYKELRDILSSKSKANSTWGKKIKQIKFSLTRFFPYRILNPVGMSIAILAPDGGGKSTIISQLTDSCSGSFDVSYKYFRPGLFKNVGQYKPNATPESKDNPNPHGKKPNGLLKSFIRFFIYNVDFLVGYFLIVWSAKIKRKLVIFDRYYYDYFADIYRYHYSFPKFVPRLFLFMIPSPDLTFILDAPAEVLFERKKELPIEELKRQREAFLKFAHNRKNVIVIDANRPIKDVVTDVTSKILRSKNKRTLKIFRNKNN